MKFSIATILLAAAALVSAEEHRVIVGKAENGTNAVCAHVLKENPIYQRVNSLSSLERIQAESSQGQSWRPNQFRVPCQEPHRNPVVFRRAMHTPA